MSELTDLMEKFKLDEMEVFKADDLTTPVFLTRLGFKAVDDDGEVTPVLLGKPFNIAMNAWEFVEKLREQAESIEFSFHRAFKVSATYEKPERGVKDIDLIEIMKKSHLDIMEVEPEGEIFYLNLRFLCRSTLGKMIPTCFKFGESVGTDALRFVSDLRSLADTIESQYKDILHYHK